MSVLNFTVHDLRVANNKRCAVSLSFDDSRITQVDHGVAILDEHGVKATFYITPHIMAQRLERWRPRPNRDTKSAITPSHIHARAISNFTVQTRLRIIPSNEWMPSWRKPTQ